MALQRELLVIAVVASGVTIFSPPVDLQGNSNVFVLIATIVGSSGLSAAGTKLEGSSDLVNWAELTGVFSSAAAPTTTSVTYTGVGAKFVRLKLGNNSSAAVYNAGLTATMG